MLYNHTIETKNSRSHSETAFTFTLNKANRIIVSFKDARLIDTGSA
jgi:hypothetical protein